MDIYCRWSKIASHFPGRTDNEIKNVWNTHLKKRLSKNNSDPCGDHDQSKEYSSITSSSSSSSSTTSVLSSGKRSSKVLPEHMHHQSEEESLDPKKPRIESHEDYHIEIQEKIYQDHDDDQGQKEPKEKLVTNTTSSASSYDSNVSNNTSQVGVSKLDDHQEDMDLLFDFKGPYDVITNMLQEVNKPEVSDYNNPTVLESVPLEADYDFWNMLDSFTSLQPNHHEVQLQDSEACDHQRSNFGPILEYSSDIETKKWFKYLENELGLEGTTENDNQNHVMHDEVLVPSENNSFHYHDLIEAKPESDSCLGFTTAYNSLWPSNNLPQSSAAI